jgi:hypothetical protein
MEHKPNPSGTLTWAILGPSRGHSSETKNQSSSDPTFYATSTNQPKHPQQDTKMNQLIEKNQLRKSNPQERSYRQDRLKNQAHEKCSF